MKIFLVIVGITVCNVSYAQKVDFNTEQQKVIDIVRSFESYNYNLNRFEIYRHGKVNRTKLFYDSAGKQVRIKHKIFTKGGLLEEIVIKSNPMKILVIKKEGKYLIVKIKHRWKTTSRAYLVVDKYVRTSNGTFVSKISE